MTQTWRSSVRKDTFIGAAAGVIGRGTVLAAVLMAVTAGNAAAAAGTVTEFGGLTANNQPAGIAAGPDGNVWFTEFKTATPKIGRITPAGVVTEFSAGITTASNPRDIVTGSDGDLWFTENGLSKIGRITPTGTVTEFSIPTAASKPTGIALGPDGNVWFGEFNTNKIGRITPTGTITEFSAGITAGSAPNGIAAGPDGNLWFTENSATGSRIGRITPTGTVTEFSAGITAGSRPDSIVAGADGNLWFTESDNTVGNKIGRITPSGTVTEFSTGITANSNLNSITKGPDGNVWFTASGGAKRIGRITPSGTVTEFSTGITTGANLKGIATGADGNVWFIEFGLSQVGKITPGDFTAPSVSCAAADAAWHGSNVSIACTASDAGSGLANAGDASFSLTTSVAAGSTSSSASTDSRSVCDVDGNCTTAGPVSGNKVDRQAPSAVCGSADGVWHNSDVSIACTASDSGSGLSNAGDASFSLTTSVAPGTETDSASTGSRGVCDGVANCTTAGPVGGNKVDRKSPSLSVTCPSSVYAGDTAQATISASDGGSGLVSSPPASVSIDTATAGTRSTSQTVTDAVGNSTTRTCDTVVDVMPAPVINAPVDSATILKNAVVTADFSCASDSRIASCVGTVSSGAAVDTASTGSKSFAVTATSTRGATSTTTVNYSVYGDSTDPTVDLRNPKEGTAYLAGISIPHAGFSCDDAGGSGLASCVGTVADGAVIDTSPGAHTFTVTATDGAGNTASKSVHYTVNEDTTPPYAVISSPVNGGTYVLGQVRNANYGCADAGGSHLVSCIGPVAKGQQIDTSTLGTHTFTVHAVDGVGNSSDTTATYTVVNGFNATAPTITGTAKIGQRLLARPGTWWGSPTSYAYEWQRSNGSGGYDAIATGSSYGLVRADVGHSLRVVVTAGNASGLFAATASAPTVAVVGAPPVNSSPPTISGTAKKGQLLRQASGGAWTGASGITYTTRWQRSDATGMTWADIPGATASSYRAVSADIGFRVRLVVTATNADGTVTVPSAASDPIAP